MSKRDRLADLRAEFPVGCRVRLIRMNDPYRPDLKPGALGTVAGIDSAAGIHVNWDCGSTLAVLDRIDECERIDRE